MPFVKLDCGILDSSLWLARPAREIFITALLMAEPYETDVPLPQLAGDNLEPTGWVVPPGWYGFIAASGPGIVSRAGLTVDDVSIQALIDLGSPDPYSRSTKHDGRRLVRVAGGFITLNYDVFRTRDYSAAERQRRYRERKRGDALRIVTPVTEGVTLTVTRYADRNAKRNAVTKKLRVTREVTQAEAEAEAEVKEREKKNAPKKPARPSSPSQEPERQSGKARPVFSGQSLSVWQWQADKLLRALGPHRDSFGDLFDWFVELDSSATKDGLVIPSRDGGAWLISQIMSEAGRRGIAIKQEPSQPLTAEQLRRRDTFGRTDEENAKNLADLEQYFARERQAKPPPT